MKLLIVDDEPYTREGLCDMLAQSGLGLESILTAKDGEQGLCVAKAERPDILLCDVRMPGMDGISLARAARLALPDCQLLLMSGYSDREYIKGALDVHALKFIDKPIEEEDLFAAIREAMERVHELMKNQQASGAAKALLKEELARAILLEGAVDAAHFRDALPVKGGGVYRCILLFPARADRKRITQILEEGELWGACAADGEGSDVLFVQFSKQNAPCARSLNAALMALDYRPAIAVGRPVSRLAELPLSYLSAREAMATLFYRPNMRIAYAEGKGSGESMDLMPSLSAFSLALKGGEQEAYAYLEALHNQLLEHTATPPDLTRMHYHSLLSVALAGHEDFISMLLDRYQAQSLWHMCMQAASLDELERILWDALGMMQRRFEQERDTSFVVSSARRYIHRHCHHEALQLKDIADHVHMSIGHLSALFKQETGHTLHQYITKCRIERACELLGSSTAKNHEIAKQVGYENPYYFGKVFLRETGLTPQQYRHG